MTLYKTSDFDPVHSRISFPHLILIPSIKNGILRNFLIYFISIFCFILSIFMSCVYDIRFPWLSGFIFFSFSLFCFFVICFFGFTGEFVRLIVTDRPKHPTLILIRWLWDFIRTDQLISNAVHTVLALSLFSISFSLLKSAVSVVNPFSWDETFALWDRFLHFGVMPWEWLAPLLSDEVVTYFINFCYNIWFFVVFFFLLKLAFSMKDNLLRQQYLIAFMLTWFLGGNVLATVFSSAGPAFYGRLGLSPDPYADQMTMLHSIAQSVNVWALEAQNLLWRGYADKNVIAGGISAMPSMHVATAVLFIFGGFGIHRVLGWAMVVYGSIILVGSVHLAWHYAVDGYVSIAITVFFLWLAGILARKQIAWNRKREEAASSR